MGSSDDLAREITELEGFLDREVWILTAAGGNEPGGLVATFVSMASIVPELPRVLVGIGKRHATWAKIEASGAFALHLIGPSKADWVLRFGVPAGTGRRKLEGLDHRPGPSGSPILTGALGWLDCRVEGRSDTGDRTVYLAEVLDAKAPDPGIEPVLTARRAFEMMPEDHRGLLRALRDLDAKADAEAILAWRRESKTRPHAPSVPGQER